MAKRQKITKKKKIDDLIADFTEEVIESSNDKDNVSELFGGDDIRKLDKMVLTPKQRKSKKRQKKKHNKIETNGPPLQKLIVKIGKHIEKELLRRVPATQPLIKSVYDARKKMDSHWLLKLQKEKRQQVIKAFTSLVERKNDKT